MILWESHNGKIDVASRHIKKQLKQLKLWLLHFLLFISNSGDADKVQMGNIMASVTHSFERVAKSAKRQAPYEW